MLLKVLMAVLYESVGVVLLAYSCCSVLETGLQSCFSWCVAEVSRLTMSGHSAVAQLRATEALERLQAGRACNLMP